MLDVWLTKPVDALSGSEHHFRWAKLAVVMRPARSFFCISSVSAPFLGLGIVACAEKRSLVLQHDINEPH